MTKCKLAKLVMAYAVTFMIAWAFCVGFFYLLNLVLARHFNLQSALSCGFGAAFGATFGAPTAAWLSRLRHRALKRR